MNLKSMNTSRRFFQIFKYIFIGIGSFSILHIYSSSFHPEYHQRIIKHLKPIVAKVNLNVSDFVFQADKERIEIDPKYEKYIRELGLSHPGENSAAVELPSNISEEIKIKVEEGYNKHGFNAFVSNLISLNRKLVDTRSDECKKKTYKNLPNCSIIIPFHNEERSLLLRTIHSIINRSPNELIAEVLLVDDASDHDRVELHEQLTNYMKRFPKVKIIRSPVRHGLIEARMLGVVNAIGTVIVFLDSHVEVMYGWLEPVLDRFTYQRELLVTMWYLQLDEDNLKFDLYDDQGPWWVGGFHWTMDFDFVSIKEYEGDHPTPRYDPKPSPTVFGSMHAIRKDYFMELGMYDSGFDIWGGEDVEYVKLNIFKRFFLIL